MGVPEEEPLDCAALASRIDPRIGPFDFCDVFGEDCMKHWIETPSAYRDGIPSLFRAARKAVATDHGHIANPKVGGDVFCRKPRLASCA